MNKAEAIARIARRTDVSEFTAGSIHFANVNSSKDVWWLDIPLAKISRDGSIGFLLYDHRPDQLYYLEVPTSYFRDNHDRLVVRTVKQCVSLDCLLRLTSCFATLGQPEAESTSPNS